MKFRITVILMFITMLSTRESVLPQEINSIDRHFYIQLKAMHNEPTVTALYGGQEIEKGQSYVFELLHGSQAGPSIGIGVEYQTTRTYSTIPNRSISFLPMYFRWQYGFEAGNIVNLYIGGQYGYNYVFFNDTSNSYVKSKDGKHFGILFGGILYQRILLESSLTLNYGELSLKSNSYRQGVSCPTFSLGLGILVD